MAEKVEPGSTMFTPAIPGPKAPEPSPTDTGIFDDDTIVTPDEWR